MELDHSPLVALVLPLPENEFGVFDNCHSTKTFSFRAKYPDPILIFCAIITDVGVICKGFGCYHAEKGLN
jgi:hypothetical protein